MIAPSPPTLSNKSKLVVPETSDPAPLWLRLSCLLLGWLPALLLGIGGATALWDAFHSEGEFIPVAGAGLFALLMSVVSGRAAVVGVLTLKREFALIVTCAAIPLSLIVVGFAFYEFGVVRRGTPSEILVWALFAYYLIVISVIYGRMACLAGPAERAKQTHPLDRASKLAD